MYSGTMVDDLIKLVVKTERDVETRELVNELAQPRVYTLIWNVPTNAPTRFLSQGVA